MKILTAMIGFALVCGCGPIVEVNVDELTLTDVKAIEMKQKPWMPGMSGEDDVSYDFERELHNGQ